MYEIVKSQLSDPQLMGSDMFSVLKSISKLVRNKDTYSLGRDLVIRALARRRACDEFEVQILMSLVRIVGLYPYMREDIEFADLNDRIAYDLHHPEAIEEVFNSLQAKIYYQLQRGSNVVVSANTSVGKSLIVDAMIATNKYRKIVIIVPTLALIDETRKRMMKKFVENFDIVTHPTQKSRTDKNTIFILTQERVRLRDDLQEVDFFVVDEFYKIDLKNLDDLARAVDLNLAFHKLASTGAQFYMLGPNVQSISGLDSYEVYFIQSSFSTVAVDIECFNLPNRGEDRPRKLIELCRFLKSPTLIYCQSIPGSTRAARRLLENLDDILPITCLEDAEWMEENYHKEWIAARALRRGIGIHHGGLPRSLQQHMVRLFNEGKIRFLICTSTLIEGVNTIAENVIIYDRRKGMEPLDFFTYKNIQGRAGRMGRYFVGKVFLLEEPLEEADTYVDYAIGNQNQNTPLSLLMQLDEADLTESSRGVIEEALRGRFLSKETLRSNPYIHPEIQDRIAGLIYNAMLSDPSLFAWNAIPNAKQLLKICEIVYHEIPSKVYSSNKILSSGQLHWHLRASTTKSGIYGYLREIARGIRPHEDLTEKIDDGLKILRNITTYRFPNDLMAIARIQSEIAMRLDFVPGSYKFYAENLENLFMPGVLAALDEYGVPLQMIKKMQSSLGPQYDLGSAVARLKSINIDDVAALTLYEKKWIKNIQITL